MRRTSTVVVWAPTGPSVRLMARATAEAAARGADLRLIAPVPPPSPWDSWRRAAHDLGVRATWRTLLRGRSAGLPEAVLREAASASVVVVDAATGAACWSDLVRCGDVYVVAAPTSRGRSAMHEPAVVAGVTDRPDSEHLLTVAVDEARMRNRHLVVVHAVGRSSLDDPTGSAWVAAATGALAQGPGASWRVPTRFVYAQRPVSAALTDHVEADDVLVIGVHPDQPGGSLDEGILRAPPCDLLLTLTTGQHDVGAVPVSWAPADTPTVADEPVAGEVRPASADPPTLSLVRP